MKGCELSAVGRCRQVRQLIGTPRWLRALTESGPQRSSRPLRNDDDD
jgi:hypothetical protein